MVGAGLADNCKRLSVLQGAEGRILKGLFPSLGTPDSSPPTSFLGRTLVSTADKMHFILFYFVHVCMHMRVGVIAARKSEDSLGCHSLPSSWSRRASLLALRHTRQTTWPRRFSCLCLPPRHRRARIAGMCSPTPGFTGSVHSQPSLLSHLPSQRLWNSPPQPGNLQNTLQYPLI